jgi:ketosteroid isomerase-like protein
MGLADDLRELVTMCEQGRTLQAIETYYADDVVVYENYERVRTGREECVAYEQQALEQGRGPAKLSAKAQAFDALSGTSFIEWSIRFVGEDERPMRLDEVAVQRWARGRIVEERFYYVGVIDEGDE